MANVQIRNVPDDVHRRLKVRAASRGQSLNDYLLDEITAFSTRPTIPELVAALRTKEPYTGPSSAQVIREDRDSR